MINTINLPPFKRMCVTIGNLPSSFMESMSYYEALCWLWNYLDKTVIPAINTEGEAITELQTAFTTLKSYVDNYFDNLDVQSEINNKLDEMAESGELTEIIAQYLQLAGVLAYNTVADLVAAENIIDGSITMTLGRNSYSDGLGAFYKIRQITVSDIIDGINIISLDVSDTLIAERINDSYENIKTNPLFYGADLSGTIDSSTAFNNCILANKGGTINLTTGTYLINDTIDLPFNNSEKVSINGNGSNIISTEDLDYLFLYGYDRVSDDINDVGFTSYIKDLSINCENGEIDNIFYVKKGFKDLHILNVKTYRSKNAITIGESTGQPADVLIDNCLFYGNGSEYEGVGIISNCSDNYINNTRIYGFRNGFLINGGCVITNTHVLLRWSNQTSANFDPIERNSETFNTAYNQTSFAIVNHITRITSCYCDSMYKFLDIPTNGLNIILTNSFYFNARNNVNSMIIDLHEDVSNLICTNNEFSMSKYNIGEIIHLRKTLSNYSQIKIKDNTIMNITNMTNAFDIGRTNDFKYKLNKTFPANTWVVVGLINNFQAYNNTTFTLYINSWFYKIRISDNNGTIDSITQLLKSTGATNYSFGVLSDGVKKYLCIKSSSESQNMKFNFEIENSSNLLFPLNVMKPGYHPIESPILLTDFSNNTPETQITLNYSIGQ